MTTINVRTEGQAVVLEIADAVRVRCKLKLTPDRARRLAEDLEKASCSSFRYECQATLRGRRGGVR